MIPPDTTRLCTCDHRQAVHVYGVRLGRKARTECTHTDAIHGECPCKTFAPKDKDGTE